MSNTSFRRQGPGESLQQENLAQPRSLFASDQSLNVMIDALVAWHQIHYNASLQNNLFEIVMFCSIFDCVMIRASPEEERVGAKRGPTLRAQWLGKQLRELRESVKLTLKQAGDYLQRDAATISRLEVGITPARAADVLALLNLYGVSEQKIRDGMERLSRDVWQKGWWDGYASEPLGGMLDHAWLEARAREIRSYDAMVVPGLLQTREYALAVISASDADADREQIERWVKFRMARQQVLAPDSSPSVEVVLDEAVLHRVIGNPHVMRAQLEHLLGAMTRRNVTIRILPFSAGAHASPEGPFTIFDMPEPYPDVAYAETRGGSVYTEAEGAESFVRAYDSIRKAALNPDKSATVIRDAADRIG
ncbi:helix-turn-helix domain-containing protein [Streptosporangium canum]|uniref:helix-turn-helix domain-containing protein n=1 Tax=Streptosporangium canum TaxID=324952 RepID=UPI001FED03FD|nr:helix-turn-helix transcriptional regulator [Streptosporangium canum]